MSKKQLQGTVVSNKMQKTIVVKVESQRKHPKYKRRYRLHKKYKAHTEEKLDVGDRVIIEETRPMSKEKRWRVVKKI